MSLLTVVRSAVAIANTVTKPLQAVVTLERYKEPTDGYGTPSYGPKIQLEAIVDWKQKQLRTTTGELTVSRAAVTFLDIKQVVSATGGNGIGDHDRVTLPDGTTGPIVDMGGFIDAGTDIPIATEIFLG